MNKQHKIEFIEGEPFCRYDGILCSPEGCKSIYGYEEELPFVDDDIIAMEDTLYTDHDLAEIICAVSQHQGETEDYDMVIDQGYGFSRWQEHRKYDNSYIMSEHTLSFFEGVRYIKPFGEFAKDYPEVGLEKYEEFVTAFDEFYKNLRNED